MIRFPDFCLISPKPKNGSDEEIEVSSSNSRLAASRCSSPGSTSPFGIDQAPSSFPAQNGPPGCTRKTSRTEETYRYINNPALTCGTGQILSPRDRAATKSERRTLSMIRLARATEIRAFKGLIPSPPAWTSWIAISISLQTCLQC